MSQPTGPQPRLDIRGAVDLSALARPRTDPGAAPAPAADPSGVVVDVTEATFGDLVQRSSSVPVVVDLWSSRYGTYEQQSPVLAGLAVAYAGRFLLARIDVDANPQVAVAFQLQTVPAVVAVIAGQPVPLFQGGYPPDEQLRDLLDQVVELAGSRGVTGRVEVPAGADQQGPSDAAAEPAEPALPPLHQAAYDAIERDDLDAAIAAYGQALRENPRDELATAGLAQVQLLARTRGLDPAAARTAAADRPGDVDAQLAVADLDVLGGRVEDAFARLIDTVRVTRDGERDRTRARLVELFEVVGATDPRVVAARRALASALY